MTFDLFFHSCVIKIQVMTSDFELDLDVINIYMPVQNRKVKGIKKLSC